MDPIVHLLLLVVLFLLLGCSSAARCSFAAGSIACNIPFLGWGVCEVDDLIRAFSVGEELEQPLRRLLGLAHQVFIGQDGSEALNGSCSFDALLQVT